MNRSFGDAVVTVQIRTVPLGRIRSRVIRALQKIQQSLGGIGRLANLIIIEQELTEIIVETASACEDCRVEVPRNWRGITIQSRVSVTAVRSRLATSRSENEQHGGEARHTTKRRNPTEKTAEVLTHASHVASLEPKVA